MGSSSARSAVGGQKAPLDPAMALTVAEAATLAGVSTASIEEGMADGSLLFETQRQNGAEVPMIRVMDLADVYPALRPTPPPEPASQLFSVETQPKGPEAAPQEQPTSMADAVRASGTDRNALIELCQDLESRLDLAERERQASTASLLMAQRRVLDLEHRRDRRPMAVAAAATLGLFGLALAFLAFRLPKTISAAARDEVSQLESRLQERSAELQASILAAGQSREAQRDEVEKARYEAQILALEARLGEARKLHMEELKKVAEVAVQNVQEERTAARAQRLSEAEERRRELASWEKRIQGAELATVAAREALKLERVLNGADRLAFRSELDDALTRHNRALDDALERLQKNAEAEAVLPFEPMETKEAPAPWWKRALQDLRD